MRQDNLTKYLVAVLVSLMGLEAHSAPLRMLIMDLKATRIEGDLTGLVSNVISSELSEYPEFEILTGADMRQMVELEAEKQAMGCDDDNSCLAELAGAIGARYVVFGEMGKVGSSVLLALNLFDSAEAKALGRVTLRSKNIDELMDDIPWAIQKLLKNTHAERGSPLPSQDRSSNTVMAKQQEPVAPPAATPRSSAEAPQQAAHNETPAPQKSLGGLVGGVGLMAAGLGATAYGGWGYASFESVMNSATSTKRDRESLLTAYVGSPIFIGAGVLSLAAGGLWLFGPGAESENE